MVQTTSYYMRHREDVKRGQNAKYRDDAAFREKKKQLSKKRYESMKRALVLHRQLLKKKLPYFPSTEANAFQK
jgi:adenine specific DNA methylase Mod